MEIRALTHQDTPAAVKLMQLLSDRGDILYKPVTEDDFNNRFFGECRWGFGAFENDALIFDGLKSKGASLIRQNGKSVHVDFGGAPCLGIWAKPGASYVCIEPWYGIDDRYNAGHDFTKKERICALSAGCEFVFPVTITTI